MTDPLDPLVAGYTAGLGSTPAPADERALQARVENTLLARARQRRVANARLRVAISATAVAAVVGCFIAFQSGQERGRSAALEQAVPSGRWLESTPSEPAHVSFTDGSALTLEQAGRARVQFVQNRGGLVHLDCGVARLSVEHHDGSTWRVAAGPYEVTAVGTEFAVDWVEDRMPPLRVAVTEGTVAVTGPGVGRRLVHRSESVEIAPAVAQAKTLEPTAAAPDVPAVSNPTARSLAPAPEPAGVAAASWRMLESQGKYAEAIAAAERAGLSRIVSSSDPDALLSLARAGRLSGRTDVARSALTACRERFGGSEQAALAAFLLGRASHGAGAARWFEVYLQEQPGGKLAREAQGRVIEAYRDAGDKGAVVRAARRYLAAYPDGPHAALARRVLGE